MKVRNEKALEMIEAENKRIKEIQAALENKKILIVDDIQDNVLILKSMLTRFKVNATGCNSGDQALKLIEEERPDLILLDINMPGLSGFDVCTKIRETPEIQDIGIILLTASNNIEKTIEGFSIGADDYLTKPFHYMEMLARVHSVITMRSYQERLRMANEQLDQFNRNLEEIVEHQVNELESVNRLRRYFSPQLVETFMERSNMPFVNERKDITVIFLDLRNFTPFTETFSHEIVMETICEFHTTCGPIIFKYNATLERFTGDGLMCFLGAPEELSNHPDQAVQMAIELHEAMATLEQKWRDNLYGLELGIGVATGEASTGLIGFEGRWDYAAIGTATNLAARLCGKAAGGEILVSDSTYQLLKHEYPLEHIGPVELKGFKEATNVYSIKG